MRKINIYPFPHNPLVRNITCFTQIKVVCAEAGTGLLSSYESGKRRGLKRVSSRRFYHG